MKLHWLSAGLLAAAMMVPASAQISVFIGAPPPPLRYEEPPPIPEPGFVWMEGYWAPDGGRYRWMPGRWERPPYPGAYWTHPHYDHYEEGWQMHEGHWDRENHDNGHWQEHGHGHDHGDHGGHGR